MPQSYAWGQEGQVDWYEMVAELGGERQKVQIFCLRSMGSAGAFHWAYPHASLRIPMMSISHSDLMPIRTERSDAGLSQCETVIDIRQEFSCFSLF